jgi:putative ATP-grasp target RiPP
MPTAILDRFAAEPLAPDSAQFPLARGSRATTEALPGVDVRPWCLRGMRESRSQVERLPLGTYDPEQQVSVDDNGRPLAVVVPHLAMSSVTDVDGDHEPSEDWKADFVPDAGN